MSEFRPEVRALIQAGRAVLLPTAADRDRVFSALAVRLGFTPDLPPPAAVSTRAGMGWQTVSALAGGALSVTLVTYAALFGHNAAHTPAPLAVRAAPRAAVTTPVASFPVDPPVASASALAPAPAEPQASAAKHERRSDSLSEEVALLARAETELHAGRFAGALRLLDEHARTFPRGVLAQERIAARVHALCGLGRVSEANTELARITPGSLQEPSARAACASTED